jgi:hypothetical protein
MAPRIISVDWSGAASDAERKIWLAEVEPDTRQVVRLECGRSRQALAQHLLEEARRSPELVVGFDFAFSLPAWFLSERGLADAPTLWQLAAREGEQWLAGCEAPFWGRPGKRRPEMADQFRLADREVQAVGGIRPKSVFQVGGAGAVGTGSLRGMPLLAQLRSGGFAVWPFDAPRFPLVVEIYPRALTGPVVKGNPAARRAYLDAQYPELEDRFGEMAAGSDDAFDALVSALVMAEHGSEFGGLPVADNEVHLMEGRIWLPPALAEQRAAETPRRPFDSSKTRVAPVFDALTAREAVEPQWLRRLLHLASPDSARPHPWDSQDLAVRERAWGTSERGLQPPVALLSWLIRNFDPPSGLPGDGFVVEQRRLLRDKNPQAIEEGLTLLRRSGGKKGWYVLEGPTYPDAYLVTSDALVVVEGKRTEAGPTTATSWMKGRHQMLRHLDAAWEVRGRRLVYGVMIVEANPSEDPLGVPLIWQDAAKDTTSDSALATSLPHRGLEERRGIADAFVGVVTWQMLVREFSLPPSALPPTLTDISGSTVANSAAPR